MKHSKILIIRFAIHVGAALAMAGVVCLSLLMEKPQTVVAQETVRVINGHRVAGRFLQVWSSHGSDQADVYVNGLPITDRRPEISLTDGKTYDTQWFERARYEAHPEKKAPYDVLLGLLGVTLTEGRPSIDPTTKQLSDPADQPFVKIAKPTGAGGKAKVWFPETGHSISGKILEYWNDYGGLRQFGFPLSEQFQEVSPTDGKSYTVQYFERNRFELHPEKRAPYEVELGLLGVQQYKLNAVPGDRLPMAPPKGVKSSKDTVVLAMDSEPDSLIPNTIGSSNFIFTQMLYNLDVNWDSKGNLWPGDVYYVPLIENGGAYYVGQGDDRHFVVKEKVRFGLRWSDGVPITSADWVYAYKLGYGDLGTDDLLNVEAPDANTVIYNFRSYNQAVATYNKPGQEKDLMSFLKPYIDSHRPITEANYFRINSVAPLPAHVLSSISPDKFDDSPYAHNPVVDGPFKVDHWDTGTQLVFVRNPYYTLTSPPLLKRVVVKFISDQSQLIAQLKTGDVDAAPYVGSHVFPALLPDQSALAAAGQTVVYTPVEGQEVIDLNVDRPQFKDRVVRQAMFTAINRHQIIDNVLGGRGSLMDTYIPPVNWASMDNPTFKAQWESKFPMNDYAFDPAKANQMLDDAGWARGPDGIRTRNGVRLEFEYITTQDNPARQEISQQIAADWKNLGIQANIKYIPASKFFSDLSQLQTRQYDAAEYGYTGYPDPGSEATSFTSSEIPTQDNNYQGENNTGYSNPTFDELNQAGTGSVSRTERAPLIAQMQHIWNEDLPALPLYSYVSTGVHKAALQEWVGGFIGYCSPTYEIAAMYFK